MMGLVRTFLGALEEFEKTTTYKRFARQGSLCCHMCVREATGFIMQHTKGRLQPSEVTRLVLLEYQI